MQSSAPPLDELSRIKLSKTEDVLPALRTVRSRPQQVRSGMTHTSILLWPGGITADRARSIRIYDNWLQVTARPLGSGFSASSSARARYGAIQATTAARRRRHRLGRSS